MNQLCFFEMEQIQGGLNEEFRRGACQAGVYLTIAGALVAAVGLGAAGLTWSLISSTVTGVGVGLGSIADYCS